MNGLSNSYRSLFLKVVLGSIVLLVFALTYVPIAVLFRMNDASMSAILTGVGAGYGFWVITLIVEYISQTSYFQDVVGMKTKPVDEVDNFKGLILEMYRGFPNWFYVDFVERAISTKMMRERLILAHFLIEGDRIVDGKTQKMYMLGPSALPLVSAWKSEELTNKLLLFTAVLFLVGLAQIFLMATR